MLLASIVPAAAQMVEDHRKQSLDSWITYVVLNRFKKAWTPQLYAAPATAAELGTISGMQVTADPAMKEKVLQMRNLEAFPDTEEFTGKPITVLANSVMTEQRW